MNSRPRLLVTASTYPRWHDDPEPGFVHELAKRLTDRFDVAVLAPHAVGAQTCEIMDGVQVYRYRYAPERWETLVNAGGITTNLKRQPWKWLLVPGFLVAQLWITWRLIRRFRPDIIHAHWLIPQGLLVTLLGKFVHAPTFVVTSHGADLFTLHTYPFMALKRLVVRCATAVTVVSTPMRAEVVALGAAESRVSIQPMGIDMQNRFTPVPGLDRSGAELLFVGRLVEKKGLDRLLAAMPKVLASCPDAFLTVAGFGPLELTLRQQVQALGLESKVNFIGAIPQTELPILYRRAALFVAPFVQAAFGDQEGLGLVVVEALACGCPVLVGDVPAVGDLPVARIDVSDPGIFAASIINILRNHDEAVEHAYAGRQWCLDRLDWQIVARSYTNLLLACMTRNKQTGIQI